MAPPFCWRDSWIHQILDVDHKTLVRYNIRFYLLAYSYGYGAPFLLEGQLDSPDPGCGPQDISKVQGNPRLWRNS